mmetsp:Transcript_117843/g.337930  ORF Transcript_117843/g.337930 Transcript_117843/m.337930 type:complete len:202 (-) Transcript_117843:184-789(-)
MMLPVSVRQERLVMLEEQVAPQARCHEALHEVVDLVVVHEHARPQRRGGPGHRGDDHSHVTFVDVAHHLRESVEVREVQTDHAQSLEGRQDHVMELGQLRDAPPSVVHRLDLADSCGESERELPLDKLRQTAQVLHGLVLQDILQADCAIGAPAHVGDLSLQELLQPVLRKGHSPSAVDSEGDGASRCHGTRGRPGRRSAP